VKGDPAASRAVVVLITAASDEQAVLIANALVGERLAACVNIVSPIRSIYRWNDAVQNDLEHLMIVKTNARLVARIELRLKDLHSYEVPEVIAIPITAGAKPYLDWLFASTSKPVAAGAKLSRSTRASRKK
jgi:periplasmic divalent cation tolerance protein